MFTDVKKPPLVFWLTKRGGLGFNLDPALMGMLIILCGVGLFVLYSAAGGERAVIVSQLIRFGIGFSVLIILAQVPTKKLLHWSPWLYLAGLISLLMVALFGYSGKGAQRWLDLGFIQFQPSELMKIFLPMMIAWYFSNAYLPPSLRHVFVAIFIIVVPAAFIVYQPDLGTATLVALIGVFLIFLAGVTWRVLTVLGSLVLLCIPLFWFFLYDYQRQRILTFFNPGSDPLGAGYHTFQAKIAVGSGGIYGKGWLNGTQSQLDFIPERATDFIFVVFAEEFGFLGTVLLLFLYSFIVVRGLSIALYAQDTYSRLLASGLSISFFVYFMVNIGMTCGLFPVVGVPLPLVSHGGTSMVTTLAAFGILMSIHSRRKSRLP